MNFEEWLEKQSFTSSSSWPILDPPTKIWLVREKISCLFKSLEVSPDSTESPKKIIKS